MFNHKRRTNASLQDDSAAMRRTLDGILQQQIRQTQIQEKTLATLASAVADVTRYKTATDAIIEKQKEQLAADDQTIASDHEAVTALQNQEIPDDLAQQVKSAADEAEAQLAALSGSGQASGTQTPGTENQEQAPDTSGATA